MTTRIVVPTLCRSGTKLVVKLLRDVGFDETELSDIPFPISKKCAFVGHIVNGQSIGWALDGMRRYPAIIPLRHPYVMAEAYERRGKVPVSILIKNFRDMVRIFDPLNPYWLPVDSSRRDVYLSVIENELDLELSHDWPVVNTAQGTAGLNWEDLDPCPEIIELTEEIQPFLDRFYPTTRREHGFRQNPVSYQA